MGDYLALQHISNLGHIAFIRGPNSITDSVLRWNGIERFAAEEGFTDRRQPCCVTEVDGGGAGVDAASKLVKPGRTFTAIVAVDDLTALSVPSTVLQVLTTIHQPMEQLGKEGTRILRFE